MRVLLVLVLGCLLSFATPAIGDDGPLTIFVGGEFTLTPEGGVDRLRMRYGSPGRQLERVLRRTIESWTFEPVIEDGAAIDIPVGFTLVLRAEPDGDEYALFIDEVQFNELGELRPTRRGTPVYPQFALERRIEARVRVYFIIEANGRVSRTHVAQVGLNLRMDHRVQDARVARLIEELQTAFARSAERAVRRWRFEPSGQAVPAAIAFDFLVDEDAGAILSEEAVARYFWSEHTDAPWMQAEGASTQAATASAMDESKARAEGILLPPDRIKPLAPVVGPVL